MHKLLFYCVYQIQQSVSLKLQLTNDFYVHFLFYLNWLFCSKIAAESYEANQMLLIFLILSISI